MSAHHPSPPGIFNNLVDPVHVAHNSVIFLYQMYDKVNNLLQ